MQGFFQGPQAQGGGLPPPPSLPAPTHLTGVPGQNQAQWQQWPMAGQGYNLHSPPPMCMAENPPQGYPLTVPQGYPGTVGQQAIGRLAYAAGANGPQQPLSMQLQLVEDSTDLQAGLSNGFTIVQVGDTVAAMRPPNTTVAKYSQQLQKWFATLDLHHSLKRASVPKRERETSESEETCGNWTVKHSGLVEFCKDLNTHGRQGLAYTSLLDRLEVSTPQSWPPWTQYSSPAQATERYLSTRSKETRCTTSSTPRPAQQ